MGSPPSEKDRKDNEGPQHEVLFAKPFAVSRFEVTFDDWDACAAYGDCDPISDSGIGRGRQPTINVTWHEAQRYVAWLSRMTGRTYRLLSEAEWECAARAGTTTVYSFGDDEAAAGEYAWFKANSENKSHPVGEKLPNAFGLYDMHGNVYEWVEDCWHLSYDGAPKDGSAWTAGGDCNNRIIRGGSRNSNPDYLRSAVRGDPEFPGSRYTNFGFRVGRTLGE